jgi:hypothetical protein
METHRRLALVEVVSSGATDSYARTIKQFTREPVQQGDQAVLLSVGDTRLLRTVRLLRRADAPADIDMDAAFDRVVTALEQSGTGFIRLASIDDPVDYQVAVNNNGEFEVWDPAGQPISNLGHALSYSSAEDAYKLVLRLVHLAKYHNVLQLDNSDPMSSLAEKLSVEVLAVQLEYKPGGPPPPQGPEYRSRSLIVRPGQYVLVQVRNDSSQVLNITALDLQPDWGITQVYPSKSDKYSLPFEPGQKEILPLRASLPAGYTEGTDVVKVFATADSTSFRWLELPPLNHPSDTVRGGLKTRNLSEASHLGGEWTTAQVSVKTTVSQDSDSKRP